MQSALIFVSSVFTLGAVLPYLRDVIKHTTKPRVVSWFTWSLLTGIASAASFADHQYASAVLTLVETVGTMLIVVFGLAYGDRKFTALDISCQLAALVGLALWPMFHSPAIAVAASITIDLVGAAPTFWHAWQQPHEETASTFLLATLGATLAVAAAGSVRITGIAYPAYLLLVNFAQWFIIVARRRHAVKGQPEELRQL